MNRGKHQRRKQRFKIGVGKSNDRTQSFVLRSYNMCTVKGKNENKTQQRTLSSFKTVPSVNNVFNK